MNASTAEAHASQRRASRPSAVPPSRLGVMGGTFDPPHIGHLIAAQEAALALDLERVLFVPAGVQPLKIGEPVSPAEHRVRMVELAIAGNPCFELSRADVDRPGPSYTVDLLALLRGQLGPQAELHFIVGADSLAELPTWKDPVRILQLSRLVAVPRPGYPLVPPEDLGLPLALARERVVCIRAPGVDLSATELRARVAQSKPIRYLVPEAVEAYIRRHHLYRSLPCA